jgi:hypothetical protein
MDEPKNGQEKQAVDKEEKLRVLFAKVFAAHGGREKLKKLKPREWTLETGKMPVPREWTLETGKMRVQADGPLRIDRFLVPE